MKVHVEWKSIFCSLQLVLKTRVSWHFMCFGLCTSLVIYLLRSSPYIGYIGGWQLQGLDSKFWPFIFVKVFLKYLVPIIDSTCSWLIEFGSPTMTLLGSSPVLDFQSSWACELWFHWGLPLCMQCCSIISILLKYDLWFCTCFASIYFTYFLLKFISDLVYFEMVGA